MPPIETADAWAGARAAPGAAGMDPDALGAAVDYAKRNDTPASQVSYDYASTDPWDESEGDLGRHIGPMPERRGGNNGVVLKDGRVVAEWGDTTRVDQTFSVAKSALSLVAGVAWDRGLFDLGARVAGDVDDGGFDSEHNAAIEWEHFLQGTSEWEGTLFGKPDSLDRNRPVGRSGGPGKDAGRDLREPGTYWEYNDVRINRLSLCLLRLLGRPLPRVFREHVMAPIGASRRWEWHGYHNSRVAVEGETMTSVSGGGHWGGGLWIPTRDLARLGRLVALGGAWGEDRLVSEAWLERSVEPCEENPGYGYLWWLNTGRELWPSAPASSFAAVGFGSNLVWIDPEHDLVAVVRWLRRDDADHRAVEDGFIRRLLEGVN